MAIAAEVDAYHRLCNQGGTWTEFGVQIQRAPGVFPPGNRVTRCFARHIAAAGHRLRTVLDLGCGTGVLALVAAHSAKHVVAVDVDPQAVANARQNALRNGLDNVECLCGDAYAPVAGRRFNLVISNPPFSDPPSREVDLPVGLFCLGSQPLLHSLLLHLKAHLVPGGKALFVTSSLSDNPRVERLAQEGGLLLTRSQRWSGQPGSQDIFLWEAQSLSD
jgi:methylase of polypeptide subunit release factors